jgi:glucose-6-phosphate dehydrogenase assembly protein OpcA
MPATTTSYSPGLPVEVGSVDRELKKLWQQNAGATRASLVNLAVYSEDAGSLEANTRMVSELTENLACRAIVIEADGRPEEDRVEAWIGAHCHVSRTGSKQICSEQISFHVQGPSTNLVPNILFGHLDSDLPLYLWWQGEFHDPIDPQLWSWVDRLIYDSREWHDVTKQLALLTAAQRQSRQRVILCDLNWTRLLRIRLALAQFFDHPASHHRFGSIDSVVIAYGPGFRSTAILFVGWLAAQLQWKLQAKSGGDITATDNNGRGIEVALKEKAGEPIGKVIVLANDVEFRVVHSPGRDLLEVSRGKPGISCAHQLLPAGGSTPVALLGDELIRGGPHKVYQNALRTIQALL